ncbi:MAG: aminoacyl-tRNA hydrolase [Planctomycetota bacterium]|nr:aminoacyl-tRNA hydrolase [Planctomycetota bacterium]MDP6838616.1 aminoacyl-tRNA hydrolase [Planctomycetota bacterium]MDP6956603.1 aminoacyl-tRNA hydrolase [Planctomycetota bacterium]
MNRLIVGLGNPGPEYDWTRHNVGFHVLDHLALHEGVLFQTAGRLDDYGGPGSIAWARLEDPPAFLIKPQAFMNRSGPPVASLARWLFSGEEAPAELDPSRIMVVYDDLDLDLGRLRIRPHGGAGGHNGMRSLIDSLGTDQFPRLRVGIGKAGPDAARHVLSRFDTGEQAEIEISVAEASEALLFWLDSGDLAQCMSRYHSRWNQDTA